MEVAQTGGDWAERQMVFVQVLVVDQKLASGLVAGERLGLFQSTARYLTSKLLTN